jgi:HPt (histidine-containing phosphotransfer) domain-containing protein
MSDTSIDIDLSFLNEIADGSDAFIVESIGLVLEQIPELLQLICKEIDGRDWVSAALTAHKLKPTLGFFGMLNSQALMQEVEQECKAGAPSPGDVITKFNQLNDILGHNMTALAQIKAEKEANL